MLSNRSNYRNLSSSADYFEEVIDPNYDAFFDNDSSFVNAINLVVSLFHFHEWLFNEYKSQICEKYGHEFNSAGGFWGHVQSVNPNFGYIRDMSNASKHVEIGGKRYHPPSTGMRHINNTFLRIPAFSSTAFESTYFDTEQNVVFEDDGYLIEMDDCVLELYGFWKSLIEELSGKTIGKKRRTTQILNGNA